MSRPQAPSPQTVAEFAALELRKAILFGRLQPGDRIQQHAISSELGISHVPVREAIQKLEAEGFIALHPRRGAFVMPLSADDAHDIFALRRLLETEALRLSITRITGEKIQLAREFCAAADGITDVVRYGELNTQFHRALYVSAGRARLQAMIEQLWLNSSRYAMLLRVRGGHFEQSQIEHWDLIEAALKCDVDGAVSILERHIEQAELKIIDLFSANSRKSR